MERPDTPLPWINYLGDADFVGLISNTAAGYCFYRDPRLRRLLRYRYNEPTGHGGGRFLYVRDDSDGDFWSPSWQPVADDLDRYACRHGLGYTVITGERGGIAVATTYLVPPGETLEVWHVRVTNRRSERAAVSLFGAVEFCLWDAWDDQTNFQRNLSTGEVEVDRNVIFHTTGYRERRDHFAYFACSEETTGFDTQRETFLGTGRGWDRPTAVETGRCNDSIAHGWAPIGAHHVTLDLAAGETSDVMFMVGYAENPPDAKFDPADAGAIDKTRVRPVIRRYTSSDGVARTVDELRRRWSERLEAFQVQTPDPHLDRIVNTWNPYQCMVTLNVARSASLFESGVGRGIGFRDSNQDLLGSLHMVPERARQRLLDLAATQLETGGAYHQYQPLTKRGNDAIGSGFNDDPLWLIVAVTAYVKETGDDSILDVAVPYENRAGSESPLYEHLQRALRYTLERLGPHGLPLIGRADWNDCLNLNAFSDEPGESFQTVANRKGGVAESVFIAGLFTLAATEFADLAKRHGHTDDALAYRGDAARMDAAVAEHGWDGDWFLRAYDYDGNVVGSRHNSEGRIYIEPQGMCTMAGIGISSGRAARALDAVGRELATDHGIMLLQPAYTHYEIRLGEITSYPPGYKENAGIFCHTNPWIVIAEATLDHADRALDYYLRINPSAREAISEIHRCEPYVYAQMIAGRDAPTHGEAKNSWLTGTASWSFVAAMQYILGIRPEYDGLRVDPCLPSKWHHFTAARRFRGATYEIEVRRAGPGARVTSMIVDGAPVEGTLVPIASPGTTVSISATVGYAAR